MKTIFILSALIAFDVLAQYAPESYVGPDQAGYYQTPAHLRGQNGQQRVIVVESGPNGERMAYPTDPRTGRRDYSRPGARMEPIPMKQSGDDSDTPRRGRRWTGTTRSVGKLKKLLAECGQPNVRISQKGIGPVEGGRNSQLLHCLIIPNGMGDYIYQIEENPDYPGAQDKEDFGHWYQNTIPDYPLK